MIALLQSIPDASTVQQGAEWLKDGYTLAAVITLALGAVIVFLGRRLMKISDEVNEERKQMLAELKNRKAVPDGN